VSVWSEVILQKYLYAQPLNRLLQNIKDQGLKISAGTITGGLKKMAALFQPVIDAFYAKQMQEQIFHNDETRWEVFEKITGKTGHRWYLWVTRSKSVIFYNIDPSRSAAVPGAHFAGIAHDQIIIICDRYSAYKKLARLSDGAILLAFCWAHVRRDFLDAATAFSSLEEWALLWKERIGTLYHLNHKRVEVWDSTLGINQQNKKFNQYHSELQETLKQMKAEAEEFVSASDKERDASTKITATAHTRQKKVLNSLLNHWEGLTRFVDRPEIPMDNNLGENAIRGPVNGRKNYYGSGSIWSAELAALLFTILQTLKLWDINPRSWVYSYLNSCAQNGGNPPEEIQQWIPWEMNQTRRKELAQADCYRPPLPNSS